MKKLLLVITLSFLLSGCVGGMLGKGAGPQAKSAEFLKGKVASGFPALPLYPESKIIESYNDKNSYGATAYTKDEIDKVIEFFDKGLPISGWESTRAQGPDTGVTFTVKNETHRGWVIVNYAIDKKTVGITYAVTAR